MAQPFAAHTNHAPATTNPSSAVASHPSPSRPHRSSDHAASSWGVENRPSHANDAAGAARSRSTGPPGSTEHCSSFDMQPTSQLSKRRSSFGFGPQSPTSLAADGSGADDAFQISIDDALSAAAASPAGVGMAESSAAPAMGPSDGASPRRASTIAATASGLGSGFWPRSLFAPTSSSGGYSSRGGGWLRRRRQGSQEQDDASRDGALMDRGGHSRIVHKGHSSEHKQKLMLADVVHSLLELNIFVIVAIFLVVWTASYVFFGVIWYLLWSNNESCIAGVHDFKDVLMFAMETQMTIGYGHKSPETRDCAWSIPLLLIHGTVQLMLDACLLGLVFAKITRPSRRVHSLRTSRKALIGNAYNRRCLMIRIGDLRAKGQLLDPRVRMFLFYDRREDDDLQACHYVPLKMDTELECDQPLMLVPLVLVHTIDMASPLYGKTLEDLHHMNAEIVVILEGAIQVTGNSLQARTSFTADDILFDHRFVNMVSRRRNGQCEVQWDAFDKVISQPASAASPKKQSIVLGRSPVTSPDKRKSATLRLPALSETPFLPGTVTDLA